MILYYLFVALPPDEFNIIELIDVVTTDYSNVKACLLAVRTTALIVES